PRPDTVVSVSINPATGCLASGDNPDRRDEFYIAGSEPVDYCPKPESPETGPAIPPSRQNAVGGQQPGTVFEEAPQVNR
ncbi:MAG: hypothetical protein HY888_09165, partial [Deltaproteobacteria bacterium]|nr:hypothetical protein [Deltaproteobacteria bacterium]